MVMVSTKYASFMVQRVTHKFNDLVRPGNKVMQTTISFHLTNEVFI